MQLHILLIYTFHNFCLAKKKKTFSQLFEFVSCKLDLSLFNYVSEISYLTVYLHEKAQEHAGFDMTFKQERKKVMVGHETDAHLNKKKKLINKTTQYVRGRQVLDIERDIRNTVIGTHVPKVTHSALSQ